MRHGGGDEDIGDVVGDVDANGAAKHRRENIRPVELVGGHFGVTGLLGDKREEKHGDEEAGAGDDHEHAVGN